MILFPAEQLCQAFIKLEELMFLAETEANNKLLAFDVTSEQFQKQVVLRLEYVQQQCARIELTGVARYLGYKLVLVASHLNTPSKLSHEARSIKEQIAQLLWERRFVYIPTEKAALLMAVDAQWQKIWKHFPPDVEADSREAIECYALGKNTACVFHLMRAVEYAMRALAMSVGINKVKSGKKSKLIPLQWAEWESVIQAIEAETAKLISLPRGKKRDAKQRYYNDAMLDLRAFKETFRNHVMHARESYDEHRAMSTITHVRSFMDRVAAGP